jgi:hypothetical protein
VARRRAALADERRGAEARALAAALDTRIAWGAFGRDVDDAAVSAGAVRTFTEAHFRPERGWLVVAGDATPTQVRAVLEGLGPLGGRLPEARPVEPEPPTPHLEERRPDRREPAMRGDVASAEVGGRDVVAVAVRVRADHETARRAAARAESLLEAWRAAPRPAEGREGTGNPRASGFALRDGAAIVASVDLTPRGERRAASDRASGATFAAHTEATGRLAWALSTVLAEAVGDGPVDHDDSLERVVAERAHALVLDEARAREAVSTEETRLGTSTRDDSDAPARRRSVEDASAEGAPMHVDAETWAVAWSVAGGREGARLADPDAPLRERARAEVRAARARVVEANTAQPRGEARSDAASLVSSSGARVEARALGNEGRIAVAVLFVGGAADDPAPLHGRAAVAAWTLRAMCGESSWTLVPVVEPDAFGAVLTVPARRTDDAAAALARLDGALGCVLARRPTDADVMSARLALDEAMAAPSAEAAALEGAALAARALSPERPGAVAPRGARDTLSAVTGADVRRWLDAARVGARTTLAAAGDMDAGALAIGLGRRLAELRRGALPADASYSRRAEAPARAQAAEGEGERQGAYAAVTAPIATTRAQDGVRAVVAWAIEVDQFGTRGATPTTVLARGAARAAAEALAGAAGVRVVGYDGGLARVDGGGGGDAASAGTLYAYVALAADDDAVDALPATVRARVARLPVASILEAVRAEARAEAARSAGALGLARKVGLERLRAGGRAATASPADGTEVDELASLLQAQPRFVVARPARARIGARPQSAAAPPESSRALRRSVPRGPGRAPRRDRGGR